MSALAYQIPTYDDNDDYNDGDDYITTADDDNS